jgi:hypothetical protein
VVTLHTSFEPLLSPSDKMPFEVSPVYLKLSYYKPPPAADPNAAPAPAPADPNAAPAAPAADPNAAPAPNAAPPAQTQPAPAAPPAPTGRE